MKNRLGILAVFCGFFALLLAFFFGFLSLKWTLYYSLVVGFLYMPVQVKLLCSSFMLCFLLTEVGFSLYHWQLSRNSLADTDESVAWKHDPLLGWVLEPGITSRFVLSSDAIDSQISINSKGLRDDEYSYEKPSHVKRILLLGDSLVAGFEVEKQELVDTQLEQLLNRDSDYTYEVINAGVRGYGTDQQLLYLQKEGVKYAPDIVLYVACENDLENIITIHRGGRKFGKSYFRRDENGELELAGVPVPKKFEPHKSTLITEKEFQEELSTYIAALQRIPRGVNLDDLPLSGHSQRGRWPVLIADLMVDVHKSHLYLMLRDLVRRHPTLSKKLVHRPPEPSEALMTQRYLLWADIVEAMREQSEEVNAEFAVVDLGLRPSKNETAEELCRARGINYVSAKGVLFEDAITEFKPEYRFRNDRHLNEAGHLRFSEFLHEFLNSRKWLY